MNISLYDPELYFFLCLLTGIAALLAVIYAFPGRKPDWQNRPLDLVGCQIKPLPRAVPSARATGAIARDGQLVPAARRSDFIRRRLS